MAEKSNVWVRHSLLASACSTDATGSTIGNGGGISSAPYKTRPPIAVSVPPRGGGGGGGGGGGSYSGTVGNRLGGGLPPGGSGGGGGAAARKDKVKDTRL